MSTVTETVSENGSTAQLPRNKKAAVPKNSNGKRKKAKGKKKPSKKAEKAAAKLKATKIDKRKREVRVYPFPAGTFQDSLEFATQIFDEGAGQAIRRLTLFDSIQKSP